MEQPKPIVQGLLIFQVLEKRHLELDDLATGTYDKIVRPAVVNNLFS